MILGYTLIYSHSYSLYMPAMLIYFGPIQPFFALRVFNTVYILCHVLLLVDELVLANHHVKKCIYKTYIHAGSGQKTKKR